MYIETYELDCKTFELSFKGKIIKQTSILFNSTVDLNGEVTLLERLVSTIICESNLGLPKVDVNCEVVVIQKFN